MEKDDLSNIVFNSIEIIFPKNPVVGDIYHIEDPCPFGPPIEEAFIFLKTSKEKASWLPIKARKEKKVKKPRSLSHSWKYSSRSKGKKGEKRRNFNLYSYRELRNYWKKHKGKIKEN